MIKSLLLTLGLMTSSQYAGASDIIKNETIAIEDLLDELYHIKIEALEDSEIDDTEREIIEEEIIRIEEFLENSEGIHSRESQPCQICH